MRTNHEIIGVSTKRFNWAKAALENDLSNFRCLDLTDKDKEDKMYYLKDAIDKVKKSKALFTEEDLTAQEHLTAIEKIFITYGVDTKTSPQLWI